MTQGIYSITAINSGKTYVGQSVNIERRWHQHLRKLRLGTHENTHMQRLYNKYGITALSFRVLEECEQENLTDRETYWYDELQPAINQIAPTDSLDVATRKAVYRLDPNNGDILQEYVSIREAARHMDGHMSLLWEVLQGNAHTAYGYAWAFVENYDASLFTPVQAGRRYNQMRKVEQCDAVTGRVLHTYLSTGDAAKAVGVSASAIKRAVWGKSKTSAGFKWRYKAPTSSVRGVSYESRRGLWRARVTRQGRTTHLGYYETEHLAGQAVDDWEKQNDDFTSRMNREVA